MHLRWSSSGDRQPAPAGQQGCRSRPAPLSPHQHMPCWERIVLRVLPADIPRLIASVSGLAARPCRLPPPRLPAETELLPRRQCADGYLSAQLHIIWEPQLRFREPTEQESAL